MTNTNPTVSASDQRKAVKAVKAVISRLRTTSSLQRYFRSCPNAAFAAVCSKPGDPGTGEWTAIRADRIATNLSAENNNYVACSSFHPR